MPRAASRQFQATGGSAGQVAIGPFSEGDRIDAVTFNLASDATGFFNIAAAWCTTRDPTAANITSGRNLLQSSAVFVNTNPAITINGAAASQNSTTVPIGTIVQTGQVWLVVQGLDPAQLTTHNCRVDVYAGETANDRIRNANALARALSGKNLGDQTPLAGPAPPPGGRFGFAQT